MRVDIMIRLRSIEHHQVWTGTELAAVDLEVLPQPDVAIAFQGTVIRGQVSDST